ncbi:cardiac-enriched FHL2-interacting protein isoform X1 [Syngnathus scovelli]|uniref:cardiac-enriched FHL2-interacting protein isoform X1 n=1 Tax=Syngnathus scovelli TaxID=161590 RepID=UPI002110C6E2|nr:uncharacterized protein LOC125978316 isoform X1 [Syngnathus scovelli]
MTSVEKRRSSRKNGGHRKQSDGGFSDTSSGGSFLDETDREVRSLTDKAFRSLCIGEEAVYNDSDLGPSSPCVQRDRQQAFRQSGPENENGDREELKRAAHESFSLMVQQLEHDLIYDGMYGAEMNRNPQWDVCGDRTQGRVSATFQHPLMEMTQEDRSLEEDPLSYFTNGATDLSLQHRRSRSRVSSLIRAFNCEDGAVMEDQLREWNDEARWNRPDMMTMPSAYQQNFTNGHSAMVGQFSSQDTNLFSTEAAAMSHMNAASSFVGLSHNNPNMMTQVDCNTNFFIHSEFSPFRIWRDHNRIQQGEVSRYMHSSEFPKWDQTPMYKELSLEPQMNGSPMFQKRGGKHHRMAPVAPNHPQQSISTSTRLQKASALEKRCESEQAVHYPHRMRTRSLGTNRLPSQRPLTASPFGEMSHNVQETLSSVEALHQQIKIMTEQNNNPRLTTNRHGPLHSDDTLFGVTMEQNAASQNTSSLSNVGQLVPMSQAEPPDSRQDVGSPHIVEHPPVCAESRGATPDARMSSYKSRASSLLFNLKDNRKRVKSTYSPTKFKGCETTEKSREPLLWESKDTVIDIPDCLQEDIQESNWTDGASHQYIQPYHSPGLFSPGSTSQSNTGQVSDYKMAQRQDETVHQSGHIPENYTRNHFSEDLALFSPYKQDVADIQVGAGAYTHKSSFNTTDMNWQMGESSQISREDAHLKERDVRHSAEVTQQNQNKHNNRNVSKESWGSPNTPNQLALKAVVAPWKQDTSPFKEKHQHAQANQQAIPVKQISPPRNDHRRESQLDTNKEAKRKPKCNIPDPDFCEKDTKENYLRQNNHGNGHKETGKTMQNQEISQRKVYPQILKEEKPKAAEQQKTSNSQNISLSASGRTERVHQVKGGQLMEVMAGQNTPKGIQSEQRQSKIQQWDHLHPKDTSALWQTGSVEAERAQPEKTIEITGVTAKSGQDEAKEQRNKQIKGKQKDRTNEKPTRAPTQVGDSKGESNYVNAKAEEMRGVQSERVQAEQADLEELKGKQRPLESVRAQPSQKDNIILDEVEEQTNRIDQEGEQKMLQEVREENVQRDETVPKQVNKEEAQLQAKAEDEMEARSGNDKQHEKKSERESKVNAQPKEEIHKAREKNYFARKAELAKMELTNMELAKVVLAKHQHTKQRSSKPTAIRTMQHHIKSEPNKIDRVKVELAKAKAELAKIKEKTKGEQSVRDKYGFSDSLPHKMTRGSNISSKDDNVTPSAVSLDVAEVNTNQSNGDNTTVSRESNKDKVTSNKGNENLYTYSESSKEFKLSQEDYLPSCVDKRETGDAVSDIGKEDKIKKLESFYPDFYSSASEHSESARNPERKHKSERLKAMAQKEKAQTKQEILTSKVKAQAEKEISALMEGFASREVFTSKNTTKPLPASQTLHLKQKPPSHEVLRDHGISISGNNATKHQTEALGMEDKALPSFEGISNQLQQLLPTEPMKSNDPTPEIAPTEMIMTPGYSASTEKQADHHEIRSPIQNKDQESKYSKEQTAVEPDENSEKLESESLIFKPDPPVNNMKSQQDASKDGVVQKDFVFGQIKSSGAEDNLKMMMGVIVTEKLDNQEGSGEPDTSFLNSSTETSQKSECLIHINSGQTKETLPTENKTQNEVGMNIHHEETTKISVTENVTEEMASPLQQYSNINPEPQSKIQVEGPMPGKAVTPTLSSINKAAAETQPQDVTTSEMAGCTLETFDAAKNCRKDQDEIKTKEMTPQLKDVTDELINTGLDSNQDSNKAAAETQFLTPSLEEDIAPDINPSKLSHIENESAPLLEEYRSDNTTPQLVKTESMNASSKHKESNVGIMNQLEDVHIDNIVISVIPAAVKTENVEKLQSTTGSDVAAVEEHQHQASASAGENMSTSIKNQETTSKDCDEPKKEKLEDKLSVQDVLASVRKLADSMKNTDRNSRMNTTREDRGTDIGHTPHATEGDYFQVQGIPGISLRDNSTHTDVSDVSKALEHSDQVSAQNKSASSTVSVENESMRKHERVAADKNSLTHSDCPTEVQNSEKMATAITVDVRKQQTNLRSGLSVRERHNSRISQPSKEEPEVKAKPKNKVSTIPEISALADYARLKVIVPEDRENKIQEFPPHKKEGFFPLIQSRHSRRPVFTAEPQEKKDKSEPKKTEINTKVSKEPRPVVFPITEKEHQRTGMFKLGEKDRREKTTSDVKDHERVLENQLPQFTQRQTTKDQVKNEVNREEVQKVDRQIVSRQRHNQMQASSHSSSINKARECHQSQPQKLIDTPNPNEKMSDLTSIDSLVLRNKGSFTKPNVEPIFQDSASRIRNVINEDTTRERKSEQSRKEKLDTYQEETKDKRLAQAKLQQQEEASKRREAIIAEDIKKKIEERRALISEERKRAQREAAYWEKVKEAQRTEEGKKGKQTEGRRTNPGKDEKRNIQEGENTLKAQEEKQVNISGGQRNRLEQRQAERTPQDEEQIRAVLIEEQRLAKRIEERRLAEQARIKKIQEGLRDEQRRERQKRAEQMMRENKETTDGKPNTNSNLREEQLSKDERVSAPEEQIRDDDVMAKMEEEYLTAQSETSSTGEEQKRASRLMDALQYYTITTADKKPKEGQTDSPLPLQQKQQTSVPAEESGSHRRLPRPHAPPSPAPSLPRSNTSSPALGGKPLMFRVKDNTKGSSFTKSVKPRFHKNFTEESRANSPIEGRAERREDDLEVLRRNTGTPINPDAVKGLNRLTPINESSVSQPASSSQDHSAPLAHHRPFSRRSIALDDDDSRSVISNMSEDVQSFATGSVDIADLRGLYDYERPVSACSFSSDMSRLGKPPSVPPKSDKALRRAQRLTTRRIKKEVTQSSATNPAEKTQQEATDRPASASTEVRSLNRHAVASPHFAPPVSLTHASTSGPGLPSTHTENLRSRRAFHASPHTTAPVSLPVTSPHVTAPVASPSPTPIFHSVTTAHPATPISPPINASALSSPHSIAPGLHSVPFPHTATPVPLHAASTHVTSPTSHHLASPHSTASPHTSATSSQPVAAPHTMASVTHSAASHVLAPVNNPSATLHVTASLANPFPYMPAFVSHPVASPHVTAPMSLPVSFPHASAQITHTAAPKTIQHVPSSPTVHYATHSAPVTQYHVDSSYPQSFPLTQRKVLQDPGSGQYFLVDAPVEVKMKTFFDPETGKYVQLNVRESGQNIFQPHLQPVLTQPIFPQVNLPQLQLKPELLSHSSPADMPFRLYKGFQAYPQVYKPQGIASMLSHRPSSGVSVHEEPYLKNNCNINQSNEIGRKSEGQHYSPEQTPYMDTVNDTNKIQNTVYSMQGSFPESDANNQLAGSLCENDNSAHPRCQPRDIISMSELDDFMEMSDW